MSTSLFSDHRLHHYPSSPATNNLIFPDLDLTPPRKLLLNFAHQNDMSSTSPHSSHFLKHLACTHYLDLELNAVDYDDDDDEDDPYSSDQFRMYEFKIRRCTRSRSHDWTVCPFAHPGEKARRRDPRKFHYTGSVCPEFRREGGCGRGDNCEFAHGVFECWLHPSRYRTEACKDGKSCKRKVCFFAHTARQLRVLPEKSRKINRDFNHCCGGGGGGGASAASSPTSTLFGLSHLSPPMSPSFSASPPMSPVSHRRQAAASRPSKLQSRFMSYKDVLTELVSSLKAMNFSEEVAVAAAAAASVSSPMKMNLNGNPWLDEINYLNSNVNGEDYYQLEEQQQQQFLMSPVTTPHYAANSSSPNLGFYGSPKINGGDHLEFVNAAERMVKVNSIDHGQNHVGSDGGAGGCDPDLGWVNELLM
ncbi:Zinc finger CCCH domain-containing protein 2 [Linum perenne]